MSDEINQKLWEVVQIGIILVAIPIIHHTFIGKLSNGRHTGDLYEVYLVFFVHEAIPFDGRQEVEQDYLALGIVLCSSHYIFCKDFSFSTALPNYPFFQIILIISLLDLRWKVMGD